MRKKRSIYYNDARHYYLFVHEPPIRLEEAYMPIDEVAGTAIDTFAYGVSRSDGCFYPSNVGRMFGDGFDNWRFAQHWRTRRNMESLIERGYDPLQLLIDRAHEKSMEFIASHRLTDYVGLEAKKIDSWGAIHEPKYSIGEGEGSEQPDFAYKEVRDHKIAIFNELCTRYDPDGIELDFAISQHYFKPDKVDSDTMTELVRIISNTARDNNKYVGVRVFPTEQMNIHAGLDIENWLKQDLIDYFLPMLYGYSILDPNMPFEWLVEKAHEADVSVYGMLQPYVAMHETGAPENIYPNPEHFRAAMSNYWEKGVDGLYTWFMDWPLKEIQRMTLTEIGDKELIAGRDKIYYLSSSHNSFIGSGYEAALPLEIKVAGKGIKHEIPFQIADNITSNRINEVILELLVGNLVSGDHLEILLNGQSLSSESVTRSYPGGTRNAYNGQRLRFNLDNIRPCKGNNNLEISLVKRPNGLEGSVSIEKVEIGIKYGSYPTGLI